ncbi:MAG: aspartate 1-decarboxylase [Candidatus Gastranaerophilales bacterium]|nr:aspartate 1-decarboxylase [Candidatus Gastranaerophilales bacterium]
MLINFLYGKIHRATVTDANLNYVGSITIDETLLNEAKLFEGQKVEILDVNNGERFQTYIIKGKKDSGCICLNGAAARKVAIGDKVIIVAYAAMTIEEHQAFSPSIVMVDENNKVKK